MFRSSYKSTESTDAVKVNVARCNAQASVCVNLAACKTSNTGRV